MKKWQLSSALLGLTVLLTACPGPTPPAEQSYTLTVNLSGLTQAPAQVKNAGTVLFDGELPSGKTFGGLKAGAVLTVTPGNVNGYETPTAQTVTLDADKTVTLAYVQQNGAALDPNRIAGRIKGTDYQLGTAYIGSPESVFFGEIPLTNNEAKADLTALKPAAADLTTGLFERGCQGSLSATGVRTLLSSSLRVYGVQSELLGYVTEKVVGGKDSALPNADIVRVYAETPMSFKGTCTGVNSDGQSSTETIDVTLNAGWNVLVTSGSGTSYDVRNASSDTRVQLVFESATPRVTVQLTPDTLTFKENETVSATAVFYQVGGYSGTVNLSTDVPGLTVEPATLTLPKLPTLSAQTLNRTESFRPQHLGTQSVETKLTFRYQGTAAYLDTPFQLLVSNAAGERVGGAAAGKLVVQRPKVAAVTNGIPVNLARGESSSVSVNLSSIGGFSGPVTVTLADLPAGVTTTPVTVTVQKDTTTTVNLPLQAATNAALGTFKVSVASPDLDSRVGSAATFELRVSPERVRVEAAGGDFVQSGAGVWLVKANTYDSNTGQGTVHLSYYVGTQLKAQASVPGMSAARLVSLNDGRVLAQGMSNGVYAAVIVNEAGTVTPLSSALSGTVAIAPHADAQGRVWAMIQEYPGVGGVSSSLVAWDPVTNTTTRLDTAAQSRWGVFASSNDGRTMIFQSTYNDESIVIDTVNGTLTRLSLGNSQSVSVAVQNSQAIWLADGKLKKRLADGTVVAYDSIELRKFIGFDRSNPEILWGATYNGIVKVDLKTMTAQTFMLNTNEIISAETLQQGGVAVVLNSYENTGSVKHLSLLN